MTDPVTIIENTTEARKDYGERYGVDEIELTPEHIAALKAGKCIASNNGEYTQFITLKTGVDVAPSDFPTLILKSESSGEVYKFKIISLEGGAVDLCDIVVPEGFERVTK
jgi:hypothetical protein